MIPFAAKRPGRARPFLGLGILLLLAAGVLTLLWFTRRSSSVESVPPPVPENHAEPEVTAFVEKRRQAVLKEPHSARAWGTLGQAFLANDMEPESLVCFAEAERLDPSNPRWPYFQGGVRLNRGEHEAALPFLQRAVERATVADPENLVPRLFLGEALLALGRVEEAEKEIHQAQARQPQEPRVHLDLALSAVARQDWNSARDHLLPCLNSPFSRQKANIQLAGVYQRLGEPSEAEKYRRQAQRLPPDSEWKDPYVMEELRWAVRKKSRYHLAETLEAAGRLREAADVLRPLVEQYPRDYLPRLALGKMLGALGENRDAERLLREALQQAPEKVQAHYYLSLVLYNEAERMKRSGDHSEKAGLFYREAAAAARQALAVKPDYGFAYMPLGLSLKRLGQRSAALEALRNAVHCNPEYAELHLYLGEMLVEEGQASAARQQLNEALQMASPDASWRPNAQALLAVLESQNAPRK